MDGIEMAAVAAHARAHGQKRGQVERLLVDMEHLGAQRGHQPLDGPDQERGAGVVVLAGVEGRTGAAEVVECCRGAVLADEGGGAAEDVDMAHDHQ